MKRKLFCLLLVVALVLTFVVGCGPKDDDPGVDAGKYKGKKVAMITDIGGINEGQLPSGFARTQSANPDLKWETSEQFNACLDFSLLDFQLYGSVDYFQKETRDILTASRPLATQGEGAQRIGNGGTVHNLGRQGMQYLEPTQIPS